MERPSCPACGSEPRSSARKVWDYDLWTCASCGLLYHPRPAPNETQDLYNADYFSGGKKWGVGYANYQETGRWEADFIWETLGPELTKYVPDKGRLLDVGCASGHMVEVANEQGWVATGIDVSEAMVEEGRKKGLDLQATVLAEAGFPPDHFSAVILMQTFEHLPDPRGSLEELHRITRKGGVIAIDVPSADSLGYKVNRTKWAQLRPPEHLQYFGRKSLGRLLTTTGWEVARSYSLYYPAFALAHFEALGGAKNKLLKGLVGTMDRFGLIEVIRKAGLGANLRMVAIRR